MVASANTFMLYKLYKCAFKRESKNATPPPQGPQPHKKKRPTKKEKKREARKAKCEGKKYKRG